MRLVLIRTATVVAFAAVAMQCPPSASQQVSIEPIDALAPTVLAGAGYSEPPAAISVYQCGPSQGACSSCQGGAPCVAHGRPCSVTRQMPCGNCAKCQRRLIGGVSQNLKCKWEHEIKPMLQATHWGYLENFTAEPFGSSLCQVMSAQVAGGQAAQFVLRRYDFLADQPELSPYGTRKLMRLASRLGEGPWPLIVETIPGNSELSEARRAYVELALQEIAGVPIAPEQVVSAADPALGMSGIESQLTFESLRRRVETGEVLRQSQGSFRPGR